MQVWLLIRMKRSELRWCRVMRSGYGACNAANSEQYSHFLICGWTLYPSGFSSVLPTSAWQQDIQGNGESW